MSYSSNAHLFYGVVPKSKLDYNLIEPILDSGDPNCELVALGDGRGEMEYSIALSVCNFEQNEFDAKFTKLKFDVPENADALISTFCEKLGLKDVKPRWYLGVSTI